MVSEEESLRTANAAYYRAFAMRDIKAMTQLWAEESVSCIHPGWPTLIGRAAIIRSYHDILANPAQPAVLHRNETVIVGSDDGRVCCVEVVEGAAMALAATNWFRRINGVWRMIHHQASPIATPVESPPVKPPPRLN